MDEGVVEDGTCAVILGRHIARRLRESGFVGSVGVMKAIVGSADGSVRRSGRGRKGNRWVMRV